MPLTTLDQRSEQRDLFPVHFAQNQIGNPVVGVVDHLFARNWRKRLRSTGKQQPQKVVDLGNRSNGRTGILVGRFLFDRNHRTQPRNFIHIGTLHRTDKLTGIGRQGLHIPALPFGIDRIERQRRLARPGESGYHGQGIPGDLHIDILEVMLPGSVNFYAAILGHIFTLMF